MKKRLYKPNQNRKTKTMHPHTEIRFSPYTPKQLYALVLDVDRYPEFLPWCRGARITRREQDAFYAELIISFKGMTERYTSKVKGNDTGTEPNIDVSLVSGPFEYLSNHWRFEAVEGGAYIHFMLDFKFKSRILDTLIGGLFSRATEKMTRAFLERAETLYGKKA